MKYINVNKHVIAGNRKHGRSEPPLRFVRTKSAKAEYGNVIEINGPCRVVYDPEHPLKCGAQVWIETDAEVEVVR